MTDRDALLTEITAKAVVHGKVILSSGREADYYVDLRRITLDATAAPLGRRRDARPHCRPRLRRRRRHDARRRPGCRGHVARRRRARSQARRIRRPQGGEGARHAAANRRSGRRGPAGAGRRRHLDYRWYAAGRGRGRCATRAPSSSRSRRSSSEVRPERSPTRASSIGRPTRWPISAGLVGRWSERI